MFDHCQGLNTTWKVRGSHGIGFGNLEIFRFNHKPGKSWNFNVVRIYIIEIYAVSLKLDLIGLNELLINHIMGFH